MAHSSSHPKNDPVSQYSAHSANAHGTWHRLADHLASVSKLAQEFLQEGRGAEEAALAGLLHDLGKYGDRFQTWRRGAGAGPLVARQTVT